MGKFFSGLADELILYTRQIAWWSASQTLKQKVGKEEREIALPCRAKQAREKGFDLYYPPLSMEVGYLVEYLESFDYVEPGLHGPLRVSFHELGAWACLNGIDLKPWEVTMLRMMSAEFASELAAADNPQRPPPWSPAPQQIDRRALAQHVKGVLRG